MKEKMFCFYIAIHYIRVLNGQFMCDVSRVNFTSVFLMESIILDSLKVNYLPAPVIEAYTRLLIHRTLYDTTTTHPLIPQALVHDGVW